jgi:sensor histidine kinase YesM
VEAALGEESNIGKSRRRFHATGGPPVRDLLPRIILSPLFGIVIPNVSGLIDHDAHGTGTLFLSYAYFTVVAFLIWEGNRRLHFRFRATTDWFARPWKRVVVILGALVVFTVPFASLSLWLWATFTGSPNGSFRSIGLAVLIVVICTTLITHVYETLYLVRGWESDRLRNETLRRERVEAELETLKMEVDPHVLFNQLHALAHLVESQSPNAVPFVQALADSYRYLLKTRRRRLVSLEHELGMLHRFAALAEVRIAGALELEIDVPPDRASGLFLPPVTLPELLDNAVKHNEGTEDEPLAVSVRLNGTHLIVSNPLRPRGGRTASTRVGLANLAERVRLTTHGSMVWEEAEGRFTVSIPLVTNEGTVDGTEC